MPRTPHLPVKALKAIHAAVDTVFDRLRQRLLGPGAEFLFGKRMVFRWDPTNTLTGLFNAASEGEGVSPNEDVLKVMLKIAGGYVDASREKTKAQVTHKVQSFLADAHNRGVQTDVKTVLGGQLSEVWGKMNTDVKRIIETETTVVRNHGIFDAVDRIATASGIEDPTMIFIVVRDQSLCDECKRIHLLPDGVTPRVFKQSEIMSGYHKKGDDSPSVCGLHPHCRCLYDGNAPVITESGVKPLRSVAVGERVLSHTGQFKEVVGTFGYEGVEADGDLYRIEFMSPKGRVHKLRVTGDHLMMTSRGWVRADELKPGVDTLSYLFKECEFCRVPFAHDIRHSDHRFCSTVCSSASRKGATRPDLLGQKQSPETVEKRSRGMKRTNAQKRQGRIRPLGLICLECQEQFQWTSGYQYGARWVYPQQPRFCSKPCASRASAREQWKDPTHREKVSEANRRSMLLQYQEGRRSPEGVAQARHALYAMGRGGSKDQRSLFKMVSSVYPDAAPEFQFGAYFCDIAIPSLKTVIEWDGGGHWLSVYKGLKTMEQKKEEDRQRDMFMQAEGWHVLRYSDKGDFGRVLSDIRRVGLNSTGGYSFRPVQIKAVVKVPKYHVSPRARLFDITVKDDSSFVIQGVVSHNCVVTVIMPGYGFTAGGRITYIGPDHDELKKQRGL